MQQRIDSQNEKRGGHVPSFVADALAGESSNGRHARTTIVPAAAAEAGFLDESNRGSLSGIPLEVLRLLNLTDEPFDDTDVTHADAAALGPSTEQRVPTGFPQASPVVVQGDHSRHSPLFSVSHAKEKWYLRVQLRKDCLADLWVRDQTPHNVLAWSDGMESWVPLLAVPELRDAIRSAQEKKTRDLLTQAPPFAQKSTPPSEGRLPLPAPTRDAKSWSMPHPRPVSTLPPPVPSTVPAPPPYRGSTLPPASRNALSSLPPQSRISTMPPPALQIPRPARLPDFNDPQGLPAGTPAVADGTLAPPMLSIAPASVPPRSATLVNLERVLWLAAGVSVATAFSVVFHAQNKGLSNASFAPIPSASLGQQSEPSLPAASVSRAPPKSEPKSHAASVEDLPLVGHRGSSRGLAKATGVPRAYGTPSPKATPGSAATSNASASGSFDPGQARRVLGSAAARARSCAEGAISGSVLVTFAPSGFVQAASLASIAGEGVRAGCVLRAFQEARVSPFSGAAVSVKKSF